MTKQSPTRMFILLPMIFLMNKVDFTNENILFGARVSFFCCQLIQLAIAFYLKSKIASTNDQRKIYVPVTQQASPFAAPPENADTPMTETTYVEHEAAKVKEFLTQCCIGATISSFIHFKFGVNQVVVLQSVMIPLNVIENALVKKYLFWKTRVWDEKLEGEAIDATPSTTTTKPEKKGNVKEEITKAWDAGTAANFDGLLPLLKPNPNVKTESDGWTALMVACGSPVDTESFITKLIELGADVTITDNDGWNAFHWCAFHDRPEAAKLLLQLANADEVQSALASKANDERTPVEVSKDESNDEVLALLSNALSAEKTIGSTEASDVRQRKPKNDDIHDID